MPHFHYLIAGGGMTADAAVRGIRQVDKNGTMGLVSQENNPPYDRPPLSKALWKGRPVERIWRKTDELGVSLHLSKELVTLDPKAKSLSDNQGVTYTYDRLLLATGGTPRKLNLAVPGIIYYRTLNDFQQLRELSNSKQNFLVVGGGFIGSEIAAALSMSGKKVSMVFLEDGVGARPFPHNLSQYINDYYRKKGVELYPGSTIDDITMRGEQYQVQIKNLGTSQVTSMSADGVIAGLGILPNTGLAEKAGLAVSNGIEVNRMLHTSQADIYAAGDVAMFYNPALDKKMRVEHEDNANQMGTIAGRNMAGEAVPYDHLPFFYSDMFELGYEAVGELDSRLNVYVDWQEPYQKGVLYYMDKQLIRGILLWNVWDQVGHARALIAEHRQYSGDDLKGRLPA